MKLKDLDENVNIAVASLVVWINCIRDPAAVRAEMSGLPVDRRMAQAMRIWVVATLIALIIQLPVYAFLHVEWTKMELYLPAVLLLLLAFLMTVAIMHLGLKLYRVPSSFPDTLAAYSVVVGAWSPVVILLALPSLVDIMTGLRAAKQAGVQDVAAVVQMVVHRVNDPAAKSLAMQVFQEVGGALLMGISIVLLVAFQRSISTMYAADGARTVSALSFAMGVLFPLPFAIMSFLYYFTFYASL